MTWIKIDRHENGFATEECLDRIFSNLPCAVCSQTESGLIPQNYGEIKNNSNMNNVENFKRIAKELGELYEKKNRCYGNSFSDTYKKLGIISAVTRISDKYNRLCNIAINPDIDNLGESLEDTLRDMASYCIMTVMELENAKIIGVDMQGNIIQVGDVEFSQQDEKILKGDVFECIENVVMDDGLVAYIKGKTYYSEFDECITDEQHEDQHFWTERDDCWRDYFKRVK